MNQKFEPHTWHETHRASLKTGDRIADTVTGFVGSWLFVSIHVLWFAAWIVFRVEPFPFGLLTMIVSLEAIFLSTFILISQNRQAQRDRHHADADYRTNLAAKGEIEDVQRRLARIENEKLDKILAFISKEK